MTNPLHSNLIQDLQIGKVGLIKGQLGGSAQVITGAVVCHAQERQTDYLYRMLQSLAQILRWKAFLLCQLQI